MAEEGTGTRQGHLGMNPIVSPETWEAARQRMLAKEKAHMRAGDAPADTRRRMPWTAVENHLRNFPLGSLTDQTEVTARPHAGKALGYQGGATSADTTAATHAGETAPAGHRLADEFEGPNAEVSPTTRENRSRALRRLLIAFFSGVAAALAWWSYGDAARQMIASSYPQPLWLAPPPALTAPKAPDMIVPSPNLDRIVAGQEPTRNTDQTTTSVDQAPSAQGDSIAVESRGDAASLPLNVTPAQAKALQTSSEKGKQLSAANQHASCFPSALAVLRNHPGGRPNWTMRAPGHEGTQCWYDAATQRPTQSKRPSN
jgi:Bacterial protein of unknown function (DUF899)